MIVSAQQKIGPYTMQMEWWGESEVGLSITHDSFDHRIYLSAEEAKRLFAFLLLHMQHLTQYDSTSDHSD